MDEIHQPLRDLGDAARREARSKTRFSIPLPPALSVRAHRPWCDDEAAMSAHVDATGQQALAIAERIVCEVAEDPVLAGSCCVDPNRPLWKAMAFREPAERVHTIRAAVPVGIENHEA